MARVTLTPPHETAPWTLEVDRVSPHTWRVTLGGQVYTVDCVFETPYQGILRCAAWSKTARFWLHPETEALSVWLDGHEVQFALPPSVTARRHQGEASTNVGQDHRVEAPMPGTILKILVAEGQTVAAAAPVVVMESMKMEMTLTAPQAGVIQAIHCQEGQLVEMKALLLELTPQMGEAS